MKVSAPELYDSETDPHEWNNVAYTADFKEVTADQRNHMLAKVDGLTWTNEAPSGYSISDDGRVQKTDFIPMENFEYKNERH